MNISKEIKEVFNLEKTEILEVIDVANKYQIVKAKCDNYFINYFPFIRGKKCFYNFGVQTLEIALISAIAEDKKTSNYVDGCCKLLNID